MALIVATDRDAIRILSLNRPEVRNALSRELRAELRDALEEARAEPAVRALVLTGAGEAFCAGLDLRELETLRERSSAENRHDARTLADLFLALYTFPKPVVAAVNGHAVAGGAGLASVCDVVVASERARIGYTEARIGFVAALVSVFLVRQLGERKARDLLLSARLLTAPEALEVGLVDEVTAAGDVLERGVERAAAMAANAPSSLAMTKALLASVAAVGVEDGLRYAVEVNALARTGDDLAEGVRAFLEKRPPRWQT